MVGDRWCPVTSGGARYCTLLCVRLLRRGLRNVGCGRRRRCASVVVTVCTASDATLRQYDVKQKQRCTALIDDHMRLRCERAPVRARSLSADGRLSRALAPTIVSVQSALAAQHSAVASWSVSVCTGRLEQVRALVVGDKRDNHNIIRGGPCVAMR